MNIDKLNYGLGDLPAVELRSELRARLNSNFAQITNAFLERLGQKRLLEVQGAYDVIEKQQLANQEMTEILSQLRTAIVDAKVQAASPVVDPKGVTQIIDAPNLSMSSQAEAYHSSDPLYSQLRRGSRNGNKNEFKDMWALMMKKWGGIKSQNSPKKASSA